MTNPNPTTKYSVRSIVYDVPSATECGRKYLVSADPETGRLACECKGAAYGRDCWHQKAIRSGLVKPRVRIAPKPAPQPAPAPQPEPTFRLLSAATRLHGSMPFGPSLNVAPPAFTLDDIYPPAVAR